jgi:zinc transport system ATP-binding protein
MNILLDVKNLTVELDGEKVINNLSFDVSEGEILTILGPNGAGKSVLLKTLLGLLPYEGKIVWHKKPKIGYLPQGLSQLSLNNDPLRVADFFGLKDPAPKSEEIAKFLSFVGLEESILGKKAGNLSGGQFQRMLVAWVLVSHPQVILFDEPTTGLDVGGGETIYSLLHTIWKKEKLTIFLVTHDLSIVYKNSTNVLCLTHKRHVCYGKPDKILNSETLEQVFGTEVKIFKHNQ